MIWSQSQPRMSRKWKILAKAAKTTAIATKWMRAAIPERGSSCAGCSGFVVGGLGGVAGVAGERWVTLVVVVPTLTVPFTLPAWTVRDPLVEL